MRARAAMLAALAAVALTGCGSSSGRGDLVVSAASSLSDAFARYGDESVRFQFAGSDELAAQIRQGVKPDLFAAASTSLPAALHREGLVERPVVFAGNQLVVAVPAEGGSVHTLADLARPGVTIAVGSPSVPIGTYTRELLERLGPAQSRAILANVRSEEPDVRGIVGKLEQGAVDAGFVYLTDVRAAEGRLAAILLPRELEPEVAYSIAVVRGAAHRAQAQRFVAGLLRGRGLQIMRAAGFERAPRG